MHFHYPLLIFYPPCAAIEEHSSLSCRASMHKYTYEVTYAPDRRESKQWIMTIEKSSCLRYKTILTLSGSNLYLKKNCISLLWPAEMRPFFLLRTPLCMKVIYCFHLSHDREILHCFRKRRTWVFCCFNYVKLLYGRWMIINDILSLYTYS